MECAIPGNAPAAMRKSLALVFLVYFVMCTTVYAANTCRFRSRDAALNFGLLDPANPVNVQVTTSVDIRCVGSDPDVAFSITDDDGFYESGPDANRMRHLTMPSEYIHYSLSYSPSSGIIPRNTEQPVIITCIVAGVDYQNAAAGSYTDSVVLSIVP